MIERKRKNDLDPIHRECTQVEESSEEELIDKVNGPSFHVRQSKYTSIQREMGEFFFSYFFFYFSRGGPFFIFLLHFSFVVVFSS